MATFQDLEHDWSMMCQDYTEWTATDLQLAAELGKTLLERNKELENNLRHHQHIIDEQSQEIEYLTKQTVALREVNDSRLRIYEQLEVSIQDLERANHRLVVDGTADKKQIKSLCKTIENFESKCEELTRTVDDLKTRLQNTQKRESVEKINNQTNTKVTNAHDVISENKTNIDEALTTKVTDSKVNTTPDVAPKEKSPGEKSLGKNKTNSNENKSTAPAEVEDEFLMQALEELRDVRNQLAYEQRRSAELEEQLAGMVQENRSIQQELGLLQNRPDAPLSNTALASLDDEGEIRTMQDELSILDEVRGGQLCGRCLRVVGQNGEELSYELGLDEDNYSKAESCLQETISEILASPVTVHRTTASLQIQGSPMKPIDLNDSSNNFNPYRDLVEKYEALLEVQRRGTGRPSLLKDELNALRKGDGSSNKSQQIQMGTHTDLSETETTSSGYSEEISNKSTQTDPSPAGSFLFSVVDGQDCKFSVYDDQRPVDSRFRNQPEYKTLFKEIFSVLKKAAENKDDGEQLPLLDDNTAADCKVPPVTPCNDTAPDSSVFTDDTASVTSSVMSEQVIESLPDNPDVQRVLTPYRRQPLEYLTVGVNVRKKSSKRKQQNRNKSPATPDPSSPRSAGRRRREFRPLDQQKFVRPAQQEWNGNSMQFYNRNVQSPCTSRSPKSTIEQREYQPSTASQDLHKLKKLELSYAEVLRKADKANSKHMVNRRS